MVRNKISNDVRNLIVENYQLGKSIKEIVLIFRLPRTTIQSIVDVYKKENRILQKPKGGHRYTKITDQMKTFIQSRVDEKCDITLNSLRLEVNTNFSVDLSVTAIYNSLKDLHYTFKRLKVVTERSISDSNTLARIQYSNQFQDLLLQKNDVIFFFLDEVGVNICMRSRYGRARSGETPILTAPGIRSRNMSICAAINKGGAKFFRQQNTAFNGTTFANFIQDFVTWLNVGNFTNAQLLWIMWLPSSTLLKICSPNGRTTSGALLQIMVTSSTG